MSEPTQAVGKPSKPRGPTEAEVFAGCRPCDPTEPPGWSDTLVQAPPPLTIVAPPLEPARPGFWLRRIHKFLYGLEELIEAVVCDAVWTSELKQLPSGGVSIEHRVRWWNPAAWVAWFRTVVLRDRVGSAYYRKRDKG